MMLKSTWCVVCCGDWWKVKEMSQFQICEIDSFFFGSWPWASQHGHSVKNADAKEQEKKAPDLQNVGHRVESVQ